MPACEDAATLVGKRLRAVDSDAALASVQAAAARAIPLCASNATLRYLKLRMDELAGTPNERDLREAVVAFPNDVRIATALARYTHTRSDAEKAVALDATYGPAQVALAEAYFDADEQKQALYVLDHVPNLGVVTGGELLRARVLLELGRGHEAIDAALRVQVPTAAKVEPTTAPDLRMEAAEATTIRGRAALSLGHRREGVYILVAALAAGDADAKARLAAELAGEERGATLAALRAVAIDAHASADWVAAARSMLQR
jgi:hypothetical protein